MRRIIPSLFAFCVLFVAGAVHAQATRTWVSGVGDDVNPCSRTAPCKTFAGAISKTATGGEISVLDPGGFGAVTITKAITLQTDGALGSILHSGVNGVVVNCTGVNLGCSVTLRNIRLNGAGATLGTSAVRVLSAGKVLLEDVVIENTSQHAVDINTAAATSVSLSRVSLRNVASTADFAAIRVAPTASSVVLTISDSQIESVQRGLFVNGAAEIYVRDTTMSGGAQDGILLAPTVLSPGPVIDVYVDSSRITDFDAAGINAAGSNTRVRIGDSTISGNATGTLAASGAVINSFGNNRILGNVNNGSVTPTTMQ